jgi:membrane protease YdiL (CAAX protease family)
MVGLLISLLVPLFFNLIVGPLFLEPRLDATLSALIGFGVHWLATLGLLLLVRIGEGQPLSSVGLRRLSWKWVLAAIGLGVALSLAVPLLTTLVGQVIPAPESGTIESTTAHYPAWVLLVGVITAGVTEECMFRAYPQERLIAVTRRPWLSATISLTLFVLAHLQGWNLAHVVGVVLPLGAALTALYLWRRNLLFVIIVHTLVDLPLVFMAWMNQAQ